MGNATVQPGFAQEPRPLGLRDRFVERVARLQVHLDGDIRDVCLDRVEPRRPSDTDAVVAVSHEVDLAQAVHLDGRRSLQALHGLLDGGPAVAHGNVFGQEVAGEVLIAPHRAHDLDERDHLGPRPWDLMISLQDRRENLKRQEGGGLSPKARQHFLRVAPGCAQRQEVFAALVLGHKACLLSKSPQGSHFPGDFLCGSGYGIRTRVSALRGRYPGPLDESATNRTHYTD